MQQLLIEKREALKKAEWSMDSCKWKKIVKKGKTLYYNPITLVLTNAPNPGFLKLEAQLEAARIAVENSEKELLMTFREKRQNFIKEQNTLNEAKKVFEKHLMDENKFNADSKFSDCKKMLKKFDFFKLIPKPERHRIFTECMKNLEEAEENGVDRKERNIRVFRRILRVMDITYETTWKQALELIENCPKVQNDKKLLKMDKEDMLIVFSDFIMELEEKEEQFKKEFDEKVQIRQRKNRERFQNLMKILHESGYINPSTHWKEIVPFFSERVEFIAMLSQPGSTPLDLFKFYVQSLKDVALKVKIEKNDEPLQPPKSSYKKKKVKIVSSWNRSLPTIKKEILDDEEITQTKEPKTKLPDWSKEAQLFECPDCFYKAKRRDHIQRHYLTIHLKQKKFKCEECQYGEFLFISSVIY